MIRITLVSLLLAVTPAWPLLNWVVRRRLVKTFPRVAVTFIAFLLLYAATLALLAIYLPAALPWIALAAVGWNIGWWWRSRSAYGARRQLPPGSLALLPHQPWLDHWHYLELARAQGPIFKASHFFHPMVCVMNLDSGLRLLKEHDDVRLRSPKVAADRFLPCGFLRGMDPNDHKTYRRVVQSLITPAVLAAWETTIAADVNEALAQLAKAPATGVYAKPAWDQLLHHSFSRLFFGIAPGTEAFRKLEAALETLALVSGRRITAAWLPSEQRTERVLAEICALLRQQTAPDCLVAELRGNPEFAGSEQVLRLLIFMFSLGGSDLAGLLQWLMKNLSDYPAEAQRLRDELDQGLPQTAPHSLTRRFTFETLRRHQVEHLYRRVLEDIDWEGFLLPKGWLLRIGLTEAHRDPAVFLNPDHFAPDRFLSESPPQSEFLPFGAFRRSCLGDGVTHAFVRQFLGTLVPHWDCRQIGEAHEDYRAWHWTPGADFYIRLEPR